MTWLMVGFSSALASPADVQEAEPSDAVMRLLSSRDPVPCETIEALTPTPAATLLVVVNTIERPPWVPMRAASCLLKNHSAEVQTDIERWVIEPSLRGLGRLVLGSLDTMPVAVALPIARKALASGSDPALARERLAEAVAPELRALVVTP